LLEPASTAPIIILFLLLLLHAFFAAAKEAIVSTRKARRLQLLDEGHPAAVMLNHLAEDASRLLATEQLALKFISFFIVALAVLVYALPLAQVLGLNNLLAVVIIIIVTVLVTLVLGDLVPRELARSRAENMALWAVYPMHWLSHLAAPLARLVTRLSRVLTGRTGESDSALLGVITEEDLRTYVDAGEEGGALKEEEKEMIYSIFDMGDTVARQIMIPRIDVVAIEADTPVSEALNVILEAGHSRLPVYEDNIDNISGILYAKDLLAHWRAGGEPRPVRGLEREVYFVPETKSVGDLLRDLQRKKVQIAIVVDEYGGMAGLVTIEDIVEEIVGEIQDEYDSDEFVMERISDNEYIFNARADLDDVNDIMSIDLPAEETDTLGGLVYTLLGRVPEIGDRVDVNEFRLTVLAVEGRRIGKVKIQRLPANSKSGPKDETAPVDKKNPSAVLGKTQRPVSG
jgi:putative hemolysin